MIKFFIKFLFEWLSSIKLIYPNFEFSPFDICEKCRETYDCTDPLEGSSIKEHLCRKCEYNEMLSQFPIKFCNKKGDNFCDVKKRCRNCFKRSFYSHYHFGSWSDKNPLKPWQVSKFSRNEQLFDCHLCGHEFELKPYRTVMKNEDKAREIKKNKLKIKSKEKVDLIGRNQWCSYCTRRKKICNNINCIWCVDNYLSCHEKYKYLNKKLNVEKFKSKYKPTTITLKDQKNLYWFTCNECEHDFEMSPYNVYIDVWCSFCTSKRLCPEENRCKICFNKTVASMKYAKYMIEEKNYELNPKRYKPYHFFLNSDVNVWFKCPDCPHEFMSNLNNVYFDRRWCPYCSNNHKKICTDKNCDFCFVRSFASLVEESKRWDYTSNEDTPRDCAISADKKRYFICQYCNNQFCMRLNDISNKGSWCNCRYNKTEAKAYKKLSSEFDKNDEKDVYKEQTFDWCKSDKTNRYYKFDFLIKSKKIIIEIDGMQHFKQVRDWTPAEYNLNRDVYKMRRALENGYHIIRVFQEDIYKPKYDWINLLSLIRKININDVPLVYYISSKQSLYNNHIKEMKYKEIEFLEE